MSRLAMIVLALVAFASGAASGFVVGRSSLEAPVVHDRRQLAAEVAKEVGASAEQARLVEKIIDRNHARFVAVREEAEPKLAAVRSEVRAEIAAVLDPDQRKRFDAYCARRDRQRAAENR